MDKFRLSLVLQLCTLAVLAIIAFELANPTPATKQGSSDYSAEIQSLQTQVQKANFSLEAICQLETLSYKAADPGRYSLPMGATCP